MSSSDLHALVAKPRGGGGGHTPGVGWMCTGCDWRFSYAVTQARAREVWELHHVVPSSDPLPDAAERKRGDGQSRVVIETDNRGRMSINLEDEQGCGHGYRLAGPKFCGCHPGVTKIRRVLSSRDVEEIRRYLAEWDEIHA